MQAPGIVEVIGEHQAYWEPFCGSLAVLLAKPEARQEVVNDLNEGVVNLARVVQDDALAPRLFDRLSRTMFCEDLYHEAAYWLQMREAERHPEPRLVCSSRELDLEAAYHYFVLSWMGRNGLVGSERESASGFCKRFTSNGGDPAVRFRNAVESIPAWWVRLRGVTVLSEDGISLLVRVEDKEGTVVYCDPPYLVKGVKYRHDLAADQHLALAVALRRFHKTRVVVSYYDDPQLEELYLAHGFEKVVRSTTKQMGNGKTAAPEVLLVKN